MPWRNFELLMGRKMQSTLPQLTENLIPKWPFLKERNVLNKQKQKKYYDQRHRTQPQPSLEEDDDVWVSIDGNKVPGCVMGPVHTPRSYTVETPPGLLRRNRCYLTKVAMSPGSRRALGLFSTSAFTSLSRSRKQTKPGEAP